PFPAIGDSIFRALLTTSCGALAANMAINGNPIGALIWMAVNFGAMFFRSRQLEFPSKEGVELVTTMQHRLAAMTDAATTVGVFIVGALVATMVNVDIAWAPTISGLTIDVQNNLDMIMPRLIPALVVGGIYWLLGKEKMTSTKAIFIVLVVSIALSALGIVA